MGVHDEHSADPVAPQHQPTCLEFQVGRTRRLPLLRLCLGATLSLWDTGHQLVHSQGELEKLLLLEPYDC